MSEVLRVLRKGGTHRIVVPDFELLARRYLAEFGEIGHEARLVQTCFVRWFSERRQEAPTNPRCADELKTFSSEMLGSGGKRHQWMYDTLTLATLLIDGGFIDPIRLTHFASAIPGWGEVGLDVNEDGSPYKQSSLYMEARKP